MLVPHLVAVSVNRIGMYCGLRSKLNLKLRLCLRSSLLTYTKVSVVGKYVDNSKGGLSPNFQHNPKSCCKRLYCTTQSVGGTPISSSGDPQPERSLVIRRAPRHNPRSVTHRAIDKCLWRVS